MAPNLYIWTPIPPLKTGTADYADLFIRDLQACVPNYNVQIVCDFGNNVTRPPTEYRGLKVHNPGCVLPKHSDLHFVFTANNNFHAFAFRFLRNRPRGKIVTFVHDLSVFMLVDRMCWDGYDGLSIDDFKDFIAHESCAPQNAVLKTLKEQCLPELMKYTLMCQSLTLKRSAALVTHSHYAALRLLLEHDFPSPPVLVMEHPRPENVDLPYVPKEHVFRVGVFGWIAESKRPVTVVRAFRQFVESLPPSDRDSVRLVFVGELAKKDLDPRKLAAAYGISDLVETTGYASEARFNAELQRCAAIVNLRFPSAGETSGTMHRARAHGIPVVLSAYQAFREEPAYKHVTLGDSEESQVASALRTLYREFRTGNISANRPNPNLALPRKLSVGEMFQAVCNIV